MQNALSQIPSFHDGYLTCIELGEKNAILSLQQYDGLKYRLHLAETKGLLANDFREGNIICSLEITTGSAPDIGLLRLLWPSPHPEAVAEYHQKHEVFLEGQRSKIERGEAVLVGLFASYGCNLVAVCGSVELVALNIDADKQNSTDAPPLGGRG